MSPEAQRIAIAKACGWQCHRPFMGGEHWYPPNLHPLSNVIGYNLPDYLNDLNAMAEVEKMIPDDESSTGRWGYIGHLIHITGAESLEVYREAFILSSATAAQRAEAFLRTIGKCDDDK